MAVAPSPAFDEVYEFLLSAPTPQDVIAFRPSEATQARVAGLLAKNKESALTLDEQAELDEFGRVEHFVRMLKIKAQQRR